MDILLTDGCITEIAEQIETVADTVIEIPGISVSPGWVDLFVKGTDPGFEYKDDLDSVAASAAKGGRIVKTKGGGKAVRGLGRAFTKRKR